MYLPHFKVIYKDLFYILTFILYNLYKPFPNKYFLYSAEKAFL